MSAEIKRAPRTYGRPKDTVAEQSNPSLQLSGPTPVSTSATPSVLSSYISQKRASSRQSPHPDVAGNESSDSDAGDAPIQLPEKWGGWKTKLKELDEEDDADGATSNFQDASNVALSGRDDTGSTQPNSPTTLHSRPVVHDVFGGPSLVRSTDMFSSPDGLEPPSPPPVANRRRTVKRVADFDEDSEDGAKASAEKPLHHINTPRDRPSSTPPTSDEELPARILPAKGKGKPSSSRTQIPALVFNEEPRTTHKNRPSDAAKTRLKAPTKKDKLETVRDRGRIAGAQRVSLQHVEVSGRNTLGHFFSTVTGRLTKAASSDDPISSFSSSPGKQLAASLEHVDETPITKPETSLLSNANLPPLDESDDENLPDVRNLLSTVQQDKTDEERQRELREKKLKLAALHRPPALQDEDDDLEIAVPEKGKAKDVGSTSKQRPSEGRKRQIQLGGITLAQQKAKQNQRSPKALSLTDGALTHEQLNKRLAQQVAQKNAEITKEKEEEWVRRGGKVMAVGGENSSLRYEAVKVYAEKGRMNAEAREARMQIDEHDEDDDASDGDWTEQKVRGSAQGSDADEEDGDITMVNEDEEDVEGKDEEEDEDMENQAPLPARVRNSGRLHIIDSDDENDENAAPLSKPASVTLRESIFGGETGETISPIEGAAMYRGSSSSMDERTEDEGDKENNTRLMFDRSEDKENKAVPRHPLAVRPTTLGRQGSLFGLEERVQRGLSMSPGDPQPASDDEPNENEAGGDRRPLQNLLPEEDPFTVERSRGVGVDLAAKLQQTSPLPASQQELESPEATLRPSFESARFGAKAGAFSQFSDDGSAFKPLQPGFSDLFESGTEQQKSVGLTEKSGTGLFALRQNKSLHLTQDVTLQPAFEVGDQLRRQADTVFEKEQGYLLEAANKKPEPPRHELYVNDHGFLTQTRPDDEDEAEVYRPSSPSQPWESSTQKSSGSSSQNTGADPQSLLRAPLRTLSLAEAVDFDPSSPERSPLRRLTKRTRTPPPPQSTGSSPSPSPAPPSHQQTALDLLRREPLKPRPKHPLKKSEYVEEEAAESDDDEMLGFGRGQGDDEDDVDGEDQDKTLETLVDDQHMDEKVVAADRVMEKFQEQLHEDDLENERLHQAAVHGDLRRKRRNRLGLDDSDDEDDEDEMRARKMRRGMHEPRIDRNDVNDLSKNPQTLAFFKVYENDLQNGDDPEFAYLQESQPAAAEDAEMGSDEEDQRGTITVAERDEKLRELARQQEEEPTFDGNDVTWLDQDSDGEMETRVKAVSRKREFGAQGTEKDHERLNKWHKTEARSRNAGTARASGRTAVTAQKAATKTSGPGPQPAARPDARRVKAQPSVLAGVASDRSSRFL